MDLLSEPTQTVSRKLPTAFKRIQRQLKPVAWNDDLIPFAYIEADPVGSTLVYTKFAALPRTFELRAGDLVAQLSLRIWSRAYSSD